MWEMSYFGSYWCSGAADVIGCLMVYNKSVLLYRINILVGFVYCECFVVVSYLSTKSQILTMAGVFLCKLTSVLYY